MADTITTSAKAPKKKKQLAFLKSAPKLAPSIGNENDSDKKDEDDDALDLFRRSKSFFPIVVKEQESPRDEMPKHERTDDGKQDSDRSTHSPSPRSAKRRKLSSPARNVKLWESPEDLYGPATPPRRVSISPSPSPQRSNKKQVTPPSARSKGKEKMHLVQSDQFPTPSRSNSHQPSADEVVAKDEDDLEHATPNEHAITTRSSTRGHEDVSIPFKKEKPSHGPITLDDSDDELMETASPPKEDDPFAHFIQRAFERENAAKAAVEAAVAARSTEEIDSPDGATPKPRESTIDAKIFVFSRMSKYPEIGVFGAKRGLHQNLGVIRRTYITWMRKKGNAASEEDESNIFLTWKGRRIYDSSTGISLGWSPSASGEFRTAARTPGFTRGGVLLEAWTQEDLDNELAAQEIQKAMDRGELVDDFPDDQPEDEQPEPAAKIRLSLKEKDKEPVKMSVQGDYEIRLVIGAYRKMKKIPDDREIKLRYEGEWLDGTVTIEQADIEDYCTVEVYIK
ncbi:DNA repair protein rad60 [Cytospora mali]|uniref:DNA repair protein rad60 n=1 Tax=Cytospora mali TaxID=578113 RepID=A0A194UQ65_CYTMA|nr:DNA repair protein rad60 [Valsa mali var. pyri (nom. inval.)]